MKNLLTILILAGGLFIYFNISNQKDKVSIKIEKEIGMISNLKGGVFISRKKQMIKARLRFKIEEGDTIVTREKSFVKLTMIDESSLSLGPNSKMEIDNYEIKSPTNKNIFINLVKGKFRTLFAKPKINKGRIKLKMPFSAMGVRGTEIYTEISDTETIVVLISGSVDLFGNNSTLLKKMVPNEQFKLDHYYKDEEFSMLNSREMENVIKVESVETESYKDLKNKTKSFSQTIDKSKKTNISSPTKNKINKKVSSKNNESPSRSQEARSSTSKSVTQKRESSSSESENKVRRESDKPSNENTPSDRKKLAELSPKLRKKVLSAKKDLAGLKLYNKKELKQIYTKFNNTRLEEVVSSLPPEDKIKILIGKELEETARVRKLIENKLALPLIDVNGKILYFDEYPELKKFIPKDKNGVITGIQLDENGEAVGTVRAEMSEEGDLVGFAKNKFGEPALIPVINADGYVEEIMALTPDETAVQVPKELSVIPVTEDGEIDEEQLINKVPPQPPKDEEKEIPPPKEPGEEGQKDGTEPEGADPRP
jgi:hypothetical protein